ncbi:NAD(P)H-dependent oxidoreductase [uncultured Limosilactobacillus sp.]|uniref:NAD(P)H-dependent oxidoreductase n=1 Tax=uncultured Limosilactobacillus sp. TaxID=2837629 RepID=UPI0025D6CCB7|nr:NAD(P)H-dependent oxidoreductase [uncultured Limosilactobacillus sp.]
MKFVAIVGTNARLSYNRKLLYFMKKHFRQAAEIDVIEIGNLPPFAKDTPTNDAIYSLKQQVRLSDGVIFSTPEYDHAIPAVEKNAIEWLTYHCDVLVHKPAMIVGASYGKQASSRAQVQMRQILMAPDCNAAIMPGNEVLIGNAMKVFDHHNLLTNQDDIDNLEQSFMEFVRFADMINDETREEEFMATKEPFVDNAYVSFPTGRLSLKEIQQIFEALPLELDLVDANDNFVWYTHDGDRINARDVRQLSEPISECHPPKALVHAQQVIDSLRRGIADVVPSAYMDSGHRIMTWYIAIRDIDGHYLGTMEVSQKVDQIVDLYNKGTWGQPAGPAMAADTTDDGTTGASDASTGASDSDTDADTGASESGTDEDADVTADGSTGASQGDDNTDN